MNVRPATVADAPGITRVWNACLGADFPLLERVLALTLFEDPTFHAGDAIVASQGNDILGCAWLKRWREPYPDSRFGATGFVGGLVVRPELQRRGIGSALLSAVEQRLRDERCERVEISGGLLHLLPGVPAQAATAQAFFERHGYVFGDELHHDLLGDPSTQGVPSRGVRLARDADELLEFLRREFPGSWQLHAQWHLSNGGRLGDFLILDVHGQIEGFCQIFRPRAWPPGPSTFWSPDWAGLGPIGVSARLRGQGLGHQLMHGSLHELALSGARTCIIDWTRLVHFYGQFGFQPYRAYRRASKAL